VPGVANRALARLAREVHVAFPAAIAALGGASPRVRLSGNPLRASVLGGDRARAAERFALQAGIPTVLVFGGSLGARTINRAMIDAAPLLASLRAQFIIQTGAAMADEVRRACARAGLAAHVNAFIEDMGDAYALADLVLCRAGAMTLAEVTACGRASVLVPYPFAAHKHQDANAAWLAERGASVVIADAECTGVRVADTLRTLLTDARRRERMAEAARAAARPHAARDVARALYRAARRPVPPALEGGDA
jgi:UDP-N-acetylglucosamine--N-acetylmuramyl-(pentapeptide) pyrophosphoryl-undecaprenol N-acetylglucosamine transferase